jgi:hypothetical protein
MTIGVPGTGSRVPAERYRPGVTSGGGISLYYILLLLLLLLVPGKVYTVLVKIINEQILDVVVRGFGSYRVVGL